MSQPLTILRLQALAIVALIVSVPYAVPALWFSFTGATAVPQFLQNPTESQRWYVIFGSAVLLLATASVYRRTLPADEAGRLILAAVTMWFTYSLSCVMLLPGHERPQSHIFLQSAFFITFLSATSVTSSTSTMTHFKIIATASAIPLCIIAISQKLGLNLLSYSEIIPGTSEAAKGKLLIASTFGHPNYMGSYLAPMFVLSAGLLRKKPGMSSLIGLTTCTAIIIALVSAGTRGSLLALLVGTAASFALRKPDKKLLLAGVSLITFIALAGICGLALTDRLTASKEIAARAFYWDLGFKMFLENPLMGIGPGQFDAMLWNFIAKDHETLPGGSWHFALTSVIRGVRPEYMHNDHLQVLVETGLIGIVLWAAIWSGISCRATALAKSTSPAVRIINAAIAGALIAIAVDAGFSFPFHLPCSGILFWGLLGLWVGWDNSNKIAVGLVKG